ncbi:hypothetical protein MRX96_050935 [Rhipicephalus microplus]
MRLDPTHTDIFNTPVIAQALAEAIWTFVLRDSELLWSRAARAGIEGLVNCFQDRYLMAVKTLGTREDELEVVAASLALSSIGKSFEERDWYKVEPAWPHWSMSHSRFFYMREAFYRCPMYSRPAGKDIVDVPLMYDQAFSRAFQCQRNDRMAKIRVKSAQDHQPDKALNAADGAELRGHPQPSSRLLAEAGAKFKALKGRKEAQVHPRLASTSSLATGAVLAQSKSAPKHDRAASPDSGHSSAAPVPPAVIINQPSEGVGAAPAIACAACIVISAFISFIVIKEALQSSMRYRSSFCCTSDVEALAQYVNGSSDPCDSFYNFICAGVVARRSDESMPMAMYFSPGPP